jgi:diketogulonate reductase-like aldo/keto reductase
VKDLNLFTEPSIVDAATKYGKSPAQIVLNWHVKHRGHIVIPKTTKLERLTENLKCFDFTLTPEEYQAIDDLECNARFFNPKFWGQFLNAPMFE